jgi:TolA-binding protein
MQLYQMGIIDQVEILKKTDVADADGVMERVGIVRNLQGQLQQAQEEIKRLQGDLQTADREAIQARKRVEVEKFGSQLDKIKNKAQAATIINEQRNRDNK